MLAMAGGDKNSGEWRSIPKIGNADLLVFVVARIGVGERRPCGRRRSASGSSVASDAARAIEATFGRLRSRTK